MKHKASKREVVEHGHDLRRAFVLLFARQAPKTHHPSETSLYRLASRQRYKATLSLRALDHSQFDTMGLDSVLRSLSGIAMINIGQRNVLYGDLLHHLREPLPLHPVLLVGRCDTQRQEATEDVHHRMHFGALLPFGPIVTGARTRLGCRLQRTIVRNRRTRLSLATGMFTQRHSTIEHCPEAAGILRHEMPLQARASAGR